MLHIANSELPFGGVGFSGQGKYHGVEGFRVFSNNKAIFLKPAMNIYPYNSLSPPFTPAKQSLFAVLLKIPGTQNQLKSFLKFLFIIILLAVVCCVF
jgi:hypothetical protein